ncbi:hypothetical protein D9613_010238 [Agrocybe pediades]|uniref:Uncharacterized protein n=1 Tax=Agrocybe pediades TaxID=84607 RepID=A0A8H4QG89_9AGAR|nr:hypothetical protein D9613_010238 [Agrocybe pediades]
MKFTIVATLLPMAATYIFGMVAAYPVGTYSTNEISERDVMSSDHNFALRRGFKTEEIDARGMISFLSKFKTSKAEKERIKKKKAASKDYKDIGKQIASEAKKEMGKNNYNVKVNYYGAGHAQHGEKAKKAVQAGWHSHKNLQQWKIADVSVTPLPSGRKMATARFHNGDGKTGASTTYLFD